jgi:hypothetical protein
MKTAVYSWRLSAERKAEVEAPEVRCLVVLPPIGSPNAATGHSDDDAETPAIRRRAMAAIGSVAGGDPACSERAANWFAKSFAESMSSAMRSLAASAVGLIDAGAILALIGRGDECTLLASRPTPTVDCRVLRPKLCSQKFSTAMSAIFTMPAAFGSSCVPARFRFADRTCGLTADSGPDGSVCQPDFADATPVRVAARERLSLILSLDHDDFETYRHPGRKEFAILPRRTRT